MPEVKKLDLPKKLNPNTERVQVKIPLKPYLRRYLVNNSFLYHCRFTSTADYIGKYLMLLLESKRKTTNKPLRIRDRDYAIIEVRINNPRKYVTQEVIEEFERFLHSKIKEEFMHDLVILWAKTNTCGLHETIYHFRAKYDLPNNELSFDALKKHYQRHYKNYKELANNRFQKNKHQMSPKKTDLQGKKHKYLKP